MRRIEIDYIVISNTIPPVNGNCRVEPIAIIDETHGAKQHGFRIISLRPFIGH